MRKSGFQLLILIVLIIGLDQWTKQLALNYLGERDLFEVIPILNFTLRWNTGVSFSFLSEYPLTLLYLNSLIAFGLIFWLFHTKDFTIAFIFAGAVGNILDRIFYGAVIDFIDFHIYSWHFAVFNIADAFISIGVFLLFITAYLKEKKIL